MALAGPGDGRTALDLGCGTGIEVTALLDDGWNVVALDTDAAALEALAALVPPPQHRRLEVRTADLADVSDLPAAHLDYAGHSLPWVRPDAFEQMWKRVRDALSPGAWLGVDLFGDHDSWVGTHEATFLSEAEARGLFTGLEVLRFDVEDAAGPSFSGPKHWHAYQVLARRPG
jgi:trans-aconitate methyltransferase